MRHIIVLLLFSLPLFAQAPAQPGLQYSSYQLLLVPQHGEGFLVATDKQQQIVFVPISSVKRALDEDGVLPVRYGDLLQLLRQMGDENQRLKAQNEALTATNEHLWKIAEKPGPETSVTVQRAPEVIVQQSAPAPDPDAERRQMRMMLLRSLLAPRSSTVNVNVTNCTQYPALCAGR
jgi:hypothetical protein